MSKTRPSYPQIRSRQRYVIDYLHSTGKTYKQGARDLNVTPSQLKHFIETKPSDLRRQYNRNKTTSKLYEAGGKRHTADIRPLARAQKTPLRRVPYKLRDVRLARSMTLPPSPESLARYENYSRAAGLIRHLYLEDEATEWNIYTLDKGLPISIREIYRMLQDGEIDQDTYDEIEEAWREIYHVSDAVAVSAA